MWVDAHDVLERDMQREVNYHYNAYDTKLGHLDTSGMEIEEVLLESICHICGESFVTQNKRMKSCSAACRQYRRVIQKDTAPGRVRAAEMSALHDKGYDFAEIYSMGYGNSVGNVRLCIEKYRKTHAEREAIKRAVRQRRIKNGMV